MSAVTIVQLYPDELGVAGDSGNVLALRVRLERAGVPVQVVHHHRGDVLPDRADIVVIGNGPLSAMRNVHSDLMSNAERIRSWVADGVPLLAVGAGMEMLGRSIEVPGEPGMPGAGVFPLVTTRSGGRHAGYVDIVTPTGQIVGFEDHRTTTALDQGAEAFGTVSRAVTGSQGKTDGVRVNAAIGTRVQGPLLPLNPRLTDEFIAVASKRAGFSYAPGAAHAELDRLAVEARGVILANIDHVFSTI